MQAAYVTNFILFLILILVYAYVFEVIHPVHYFYLIHFVWSVAS